MRAYKIETVESNGTPKKETIVIMHVRVQLDFVKCIFCTQAQKPTLE